MKRTLTCVWRGLKKRKKRSKISKKNKITIELHSLLKDIIKSFWLVVLCALIGAMGFFLLTRNAEIYSNNRQIRNLAKEKTNMQILINTVEKEGSAGNEINTYFNITQRYDFIE